MSSILKQPLTAYQKWLRAKSWAMRSLCMAFTAGIVGVLLLITGYLTSIGAKSLSWDFFTRLPIPIGMDHAPGGMANAVVGTIILVALASVIGVPMGLLTGIYLSEYSAFSKLAAPVRFIADVLAGVPSIVVGILGYELLVAPWSYWNGHLNLFGHDWRLLPNGNYNGYAGAFGLAFIMVPIVSRTTEEMLRLVPQSYREASIALGATKARTILSVVVPSATGSLVTGVMLAIARVAGETAPLLFTALGTRLMNMDPARPFPSLTAQIFEYASGPVKEQRELAWAGILVLIALIFILNLAVRLATRSKHAAGH